MKKALSVAMLALLVFGGCKKDDPETTNNNSNNNNNTAGYTCASCTKSPEAKAAYDNNSGGIYKGAIVGSTGTFEIDLQTDSTATYTLDGQTVTLPLETHSTASTDQFIFSDGTNSLSFEVHLDGSSPNVGLTVQGHSIIAAAVYKELSTQLVRVFEGTYSGTTQGTLNIVQQGASTKVIYKSPASTAGYIYGTVSGSNSFAGTNGDVTYTGTYKANTTEEVSGSWSDSGGGTGSWTAKRTM